MAIAGENSPARRDREAFASDGELLAEIYGGEWVLQPAYGTHSKNGSQHCTRAARVKPFEPAALGPRVESYRE
jgi:hypothetical protein